MNPITLDAKYYDALEKKLDNEKFYTKIWKDANANNATERIAIYSIDKGITVKLHHVKKYPTMTVYGYSYTEKPIMIGHRLDILVDDIRNNYK